MHCAVIRHCCFWCVCSVCQHLQGLPTCVLRPSVGIDHSGPGTVQQALNEIEESLRTMFGSNTVQNNSRATVHETIVVNAAALNVACTWMMPQCLPEAGGVSLPPCSGPCEHLAEVVQMTRQGWSTDNSVRSICQDGSVTALVSCCVVLDLMAWPADGDVPCTELEQILGRF